jgi:hypothetical protein
VSSEKWLENFSPVEKIKNSGLWLVQGLYKNGLDKNELNEIERILIKK